MKSSHNIILMATLLVIAMQPVSQAILTSADNQMWHLDKSGIAGVAKNRDHFGESLASGDFNNDGCSDLVVGIPGRHYYLDSLHQIYYGAISIIYGSQAGLQSSDSQFISQEVPGMPGQHENDFFGQAVTTGDFNKDGYDDLVIGVPGEVIGTVNCGMVHVLYGTQSGITFTNNQVWHPVNLEVNSYGGESFGHALASGDINGDGYADLLVGVPDQEVVGVTNAGAVHLIYGSSNGLIKTDNQTLRLSIDPDSAYHTQDSAGYGYSVASGDINNDGFDDIVIGVPYYSLGEDWYNINANEGIVHIVYGSSAGAVRNFDRVWHQDTPLIKGGPERPDNFGKVVCTGDFNKDSFDDVVVAVPGESVDGSAQAGMVNVIYGSSNGLTATNNQAWHQNSSGIKGEVEAFDNFGNSLTTGDFNRDGYSDLAIGVQGEGIKNKEKWWKVIERVDAGMVNVLYGSVSGLTNHNDQTWHQNSGGIAGEVEHFDYFGASLTAADFDGNGSDDLAIGVDWEDIHNDYLEHINEGAVNVIYSSPGNRAPIADAGEGTNVVCEAGTTVMFVLNGTGSHDPDGHEITYAWKWSGGTATGELAEVELPLGTNVITLIVSDEQEDSEPDAVIITVVDISPPVFNSIVASPTLLSQPNHRMIPVEVGITATDNCDSSPDVTLDAVTMNEGESDDCVILDTYNAMLRSECSGHMPERVYTLHYSATDDWGNTASTSIDVVVPHDRGKRNNKK